MAYALTTVGIVQRHNKLSNSIKIWKDELKIENLHIAMMPGRTDTQ